MIYRLCLIRSYPFGSQNCSPSLFLCLFHSSRIPAIRCLQVMGHCVALRCDCTFGWELLLLSSSAFLEYIFLYLACLVWRLLCCIYLMHGALKRDSKTKMDYDWCLHLHLFLTAIRPGMSLTPFMSAHGRKMGVQYAQYATCSDIYCSLPLLIKDTVKRA